MLLICRQHFNKVLVKLFQVSATILMSIFSKKLLTKNFNGLQLHFWIPSKWKFINFFSEFHFIKFYSISLQHASRHQKLLLLRNGNCMGNWWKNLILMFLFLSCDHLFCISTPTQFVSSAIKYKNMLRKENKMKLD